MDFTNTGTTGVGLDMLEFMGLDGAERILCRHASFRYAPLCDPGRRENTNDTDENSLLAPSYFSCVDGEAAGGYTIQLRPAFSGCQVIWGAYKKIVCNNDANLRIYNPLTFF
jgi:hypothetical protein